MGVIPTSMHDKIAPGQLLAEARAYDHPTPASSSSGYHGYGVAFLFWCSIRSEGWSVPYVTDPFVWLCSYGKATPVWDLTRRGQ